jgi:hypothetical protein
MRQCLRVVVADDYENVGVADRNAMDIHPRAVGLCNPSATSVRSDDLAVARDEGVRWVIFTSIFRVKSHRTLRLHHAQSAIAAPCPCPETRQCPDVCVLTFARWIRMLRLEVVRIKTSVSPVRVPWVAWLAAARYSKSSGDQSLAE